MMTRELRLVGAGGEPVDLVRTLNSHGFVDLPPMRPDADYRAVELTLRTRRGRPRRVRVEADRNRHARVTILGRAVSQAVSDDLLASVRHVLRLDADLSPFYAAASADEELSWVTSGAGRMIQSPTVFEDVVKTVCTTNCTWSATVRMVYALVEHLGEPAVGAPKDGPWGRAFPTPVAMAEAGERFYRDVARTGYRGAYLAGLARSVAEGELDLEGFGRASATELPDAELEARLLALPGVGPYAAAHVMMTLGRYHRLILDSWTRPTYARLVSSSEAVDPAEASRSEASAAKKKAGRRLATDAAIERRFRRYGPYAGLAFWLYLTRDWVDEEVHPASAPGGAPK
jgi:3-methyladenine DNA glycosylase/8-oxoguanine DNA glycosylase